MGSLAILKLNGERVVWIQRWIEVDCSVLSDAGEFSLDVDRFDRFCYLLWLMLGWTGTGIGMRDSMSIKAGCQCGRRQQRYLGGIKGYAAE